MPDDGSPAPRVGGRVRSLVDDGFLTPGLGGRVTNRVPTLSSVRVCWDNDTASVVRLDLLEPAGDDHRS